MSAGATGVTGLLARLRQRAAGGGVSGLIGPSLGAKLKELSVERRLELRAEATAIRVQFEADIAAARAAEEKAVRAVLRDRFDSGAAEPFTPPAAGAMPAQLGVCKRFVQRYAAEFGVPAALLDEADAGCVLGLLNNRVQAIEISLAATYQSAGEPAAAVELRARIREAMRAEWAPRKAQREAHERNSGSRGIFEQEAHEANAALWAAEAVTAGLRRELYDSFALR